MYSDVQIRGRTKYSTALNTIRARMMARPNMTPSTDILSNHSKRAYKPGMTNEERNKEYDAYVTGYDKDSVIGKYIAPRMAAEKVAEYITTADRRNAIVLDIGAGTGLVGTELLKVGFEQIDAVEPSQGMMAAAKVKGVYRKIICESFSENPLDQPAGSYDVITAVGCHGPNQVPALAFYEMIRLSKKGAIICVITRSNNYQCEDGFDDLLYPVCEKLEKEGRWKKKEVYTFPKYCREIEGILLVYEVL